MDADAWNRRYDTDELVWHAEPNRFVAEEVTGLQAGRALDLACGEGRNAVWLAEHGWVVTGVDFSSVALDKARQLADRRGVEVTWARRDLTDWTPAPGSVDLVVHAYLHLPQPERSDVLRAAAAALAPGGTLVLVAHDRANLSDGVGGPQDAAVLPTPDEVVADLTAAVPGLEVARAEVATRAVTTEAGTVDALDTVVRVRRP